MNELNILNNVEMMSTLEIAKLTGKLLKHVNRDTKLMKNELEKDGPNLDHEQYQEVTDKRGYTKEILLDKELTLTLISGYSIKLRNNVIKRWQALEAEKIGQDKSGPLYEPYDDFFRGLREVHKDEPEKIKCYAHLGSKAMINARRAKKWYREQFLPHFRVILGIAEPGDTVMIGYTDDPTTLEQVSYKFARQWPDLLYLSCSTQNDLFAI